MYGPERRLTHKSGRNAYPTQVPSLTAKDAQRQIVRRDYIDRSREQGDVNYAKRFTLHCYEDGNIREGDGTSSNRLSVTQNLLPSPIFPLKLHMILDKIEDSNTDMKNAISWLPHGRAFYIRNTDIFKREILAKYFKNCKISSFYRQINLYGFIRLTTGCEAGAYYHEYFLRGRAFLTKNITRIKLKRSKVGRVSALNQEPNFYAMAPVCSMQQSIEMPSGVVPHNNRETSAALLAAIHEVERMSYTNAESQNLRYNIPHNAIQSGFPGRVPDSQASVSQPSPLSLFNRDGCMTDGLLLPYNGTPGTVYHDMTRATAVHNELSRTTIQNEMLQVAAHAETTRGTTRAATQNELSLFLMQNELSRNVQTLAQPF